MHISANLPFSCYTNNLNPYFRYGNGYSVSLFFAKVEDVDEGMNFVASRQELMN